MEEEKKPFIPCIALCHGHYHSNSKVTNTDSIPVPFTCIFSKGKIVASLSETVEKYQEPGKTNIF